MIDFLLLICLLLVLGGVISVVLVEVTVYYWRYFQPSALINPTLLMLMTALPLWFGLLILLALGFSFFGKGLGLIEDHCLLHGLSHPHLCFEHLSIQQSNIVVTGFLLFMLAAFVYRFIPVLRTLWSQLIIYRSLEKLQSKPVNWVDTKSEIAFVCGFFNPRIYLSKSIRQRLNSKMLRVVLAHEIQHIRNRDVIKMWGVEFAITIFRESTQRFLRKAWINRREQRIDQQLSSRFGRATVAESLISMLDVHARQNALNINDGNVELRIMALIQEESKVAGKIFYGGSVLVTIVLAIAIATQHHALETLIGWVN